MVMQYLYTLSNDDLTKGLVMVCYYIKLQRHYYCSLYVVCYNPVIYFITGSWDLLSPSLSLFPAGHHHQALGAVSASGTLGGQDLVRRIVFLPSLASHEGPLKLLLFYNITYGIFGSLRVGWRTGGLDPASHLYMFL